MANAVITSDATKVKTVFNDCEAITGYSVGYYAKDAISSVLVDSSSNTVQIFLECGSMYVVSLNGANRSIIVDTVNGATPSDLADLADKIAAFMV